MSRKLQVRAGFMRMVRLGPLEYGDQDRWEGRAPAKKGMWAFPWPFYDEFFSYHKYLDALPKKFRKKWPTDPSCYEDENTGETMTEVIFHSEDGYPLNAFLKEEYTNEKDEWVEKIGRKVVKKREFWYSGEVYTHFNHDGSIGHYSPIFDDAPIQWTLMNVTELAKHIRSSGADHTLMRDDFITGGKLVRVPTTVDHLEVFIPPHSGVIKSHPTKMKDL